MIVVLTAPREGARYVQQTLEEVRRQAITPVTLVVDGDGCRAIQGQVVHVKKRGDGNRRAFFEVLTMAAKENAELVFFEDDVRLCRNAVPYICDFIVPGGIGWASFFTPIPMRSGVGHGMHVGSPGTSRFLQAVKFVPAAAQALSAWFWKNCEDTDNGSADQALAQAAKALGMRWAAHAPDLVEHIGEISAFGDGRKLAWYRKSSDWPGVDFDAFSLRG